MKKGLNQPTVAPLKTENGQIGVPVNKLPAESEIRAAFRFVYDTLEGMMLISHYVLLGDSARAVKYEDYTPIEKIEVGIQANRMTPEVKQTLREWGYVETEDGFEKTMLNVPIIFKTIKRKYEFFQNPDTHFFDVDEYKIPNPFEKYWATRHLIR